MGNEDTITPGPWHRRGATITGAGQGQRICVMHAGQGANARLISAAPDMLAALQAVLVDVMTVDNNSGLSLETGRQVKDALNAALGDPVREDGGAS